MLLSWVPFSKLINVLWLLFRVYWHAQGEVQTRCQYKHSPQPHLSLSHTQWSQSHQDIYTTTNHANIGVGWQRTRLAVYIHKPLGTPFKKWGHQRYKRWFITMRHLVISLTFTLSFFCLFRFFLCLLFFFFCFVLKGDNGKTEDNSLVSSSRGLKPMPHYVQVIDHRLAFKTNKQFHVTFLSSKDFMLRNTYLLLQWTFECLCSIYYLYLSVCLVAFLCFYSSFSAIS